MSPVAIGSRCIETWSGAFDIAHALANVCRFQGHTNRHYSVAEHSLYVADLLSLWGCGRMTILGGLLHDASEAYIADLASPLKHDAFGKSYRDVEQSVMEKVAARFGFLWPLERAITQADCVLLWCEASILMPSRATTWGLYESFGKQCIADHPHVCEWIRQGTHMPSIVSETSATFTLYALNFGSQ
jgi:hypothetical protein